MVDTKAAVEGGCHCGAVRFRAVIARTPGAPLVAHACNCSICRMVGFEHLIVAADDFELLRGEADLSCYTFNTGVARHYFCRHCGVKSFYIPRSNPDGYSVNLRCLDTPPEGVEVEPFDGQNWEAHAGALAHLSKQEDH
ncbi:GFA family protein [Microbulbifer sp. SAOS-129_SWC]|uniref:GFA family protein n=1 Tax=Microbulbifer sp. SAOS-129_SWC TaxID=3145235 RepID=UPI0032180118